MPKRVKVYGCEKCGGYVDGGVCRKCGHDHRPQKVKPVHEPQPDHVPALPSPADVLGQPGLDAILGGVDPGAFAEPDQPQTGQAQDLTSPDKGWVMTPAGPVWQGHVEAKGLGGGDGLDWEQAAEALKAEYRAEMEMLAGYKPSPRPPGWSQMLRNCGRA